MHPHKYPSREPQTCAGRPHLQQTALICSLFIDDERTINYAEVFNKNDSKLFAELFADDCIFYDTAPTCAGMDPMFVRGKEGVDMIFNMYFHSMPMSAKPVSLNGNVLDYIICYPGIEIPCRGELLEEKDGKIARYHVCYRAE